MEVRMKHSVVANLTTEFAIGLGWIKKLWEDEGMGEFTITSLKDGVHGRNSQHRWDQDADIPGEAADIRTRHHFDRETGRHSEKLIRFAQRLQDEGWAVVVHPDWLPGVEHLHFAAKKDIFKRVD